MQENSCCSHMNPSPITHLLRENSALLAKVVALEKKLSQSEKKMMSFYGNVIELRAILLGLQELIGIRIIELRRKSQTSGVLLDERISAKANHWATQLNKALENVTALQMSTYPGSASAGQAMLNGSSSRCTITGAKLSAQPSGTYQVCLELNLNLTPTKEQSHGT